MKQLLQARFADGTTISRRSARAYAYAWRVTGEWNGKPAAVTGFSVSYERACSGATRYCSAAAAWINPKVEIVEVRR